METSLKEFKVRDSWTSREKHTFPFHSLSKIPVPRVESVDRGKNAMLSNTSYSSSIQKNLVI